MPEMTRNLAAWLVAEGTGTGIGQDVFLDKRPPTPDQCLTLKDTGGYAPARGMMDLRRTCQVMARAKGNQAAKVLAWEAYGRCRPVDGRPVHVVVEGAHYLVVPIQPPTPLGDDDQGRNLYSFNLVVTALPDAEA